MVTHCSSAHPLGFHFSLCFLSYLWWDFLFITCVPIVLSPLPHPLSSCQMAALKGLALFPSSALAAFPMQTFSPVVAFVQSTAAATAADQKNQKAKPRWAVSLFLFVHSVFNPHPPSLELWDVPCIISNTIKPFWVKCTLASRPTGQFICLQQQHSAPRCRCLPSDMDAYRIRPLFRCLPLASPLPALCIDSPPGHV